MRLAMQNIITLQFTQFKVVLEIREALQVATKVHGQIEFPEAFAAIHTLNPGNVVQGQVQILEVVQFVQILCRSIERNAHSVS